MDEDIGVDVVAMVMVMAGRREKQVLTRLKVSPSRQTGGPFQEFGRLG